MKAVVKTRRGEGNVEVREVEEPRAEPDEVVIEVHSAGICGSDIHIYHDDIKIPLNPPVVMGHEFSGLIAEIGKNVRNLKVGDGVTSETAARVCGVCLYCRTGDYNLCPYRLTIGYGVNGAFTKYCLVPKERVHKLPQNIDLMAAALCEPLSCCVHGVIEKTGIAAGEMVVVTGPGAIGLLSLQVAKAEGAKVVVSGTSQDGERLALAKDLGADITVNVEKENLVHIIRDLTQGYGADAVFECSGAPAAASLGLDVVRKKGKYTQIGLFGRPMEIDFEKIAYKEIQVRGSFSQKWTAWKRALELLSQKKVKTKPLISEVLPITKWKEGFRKHQEKRGVKILLTPLK